MERVVEFILNKFPFIARRLDDHMREVIQGASIALVLKVIGAVLAFSFNLLLARALGAEGAGVYFLALTVTTIATVFGRMGLDNTLLRFTAANASVDDWQAVKGVYSKGIRLALAASTASTAIVFAAAPLLANVAFRKPELAVPLRWMSLAIVPMTMLMLHAEMLKGLKRIMESMLVYDASVPALSVAGLLIVGGSQGPQGAVWAYTVAAIITALLGIILWRSATPHLKKETGRFETRKLLESSMPLFWVASMVLVIRWMAIIALGIWGTKEDIGVFSIASRTANLTALVLMSINSITAPKFAALYKQGEMQALGSTARNTAKMMTILATPLLLLFLIAPQWVMKQFGSEFSNGAMLLSILAIGQFVNVASGSVGFLLVMSGNERLMRNNVIVIAILCVTLNVCLVPPFGVLGAAIATAICLAASNLIAAYLAWAQLGIMTIPFVKIGRNKHANN